MLTYLECSIVLFLTKMNDDAVASGLKIWRFPDLVLKTILRLIRFDWQRPKITHQLSSDVDSFDTFFQRCPTNFQPVRREQRNKEIFVKNNQNCPNLGIKSSFFFMRSTSLSTKLFEENKQHKTPEVHERCFFLQFNQLSSTFWSHKKDIGYRIAATGQKKKACLQKVWIFSLPTVCVWSCTTGAFITVGDDVNQTLRKNIWTLGHRSARGGVGGVDCVLVAMMVW